MSVLQTDRLTLRMLRESDLDGYAEMCADPEVMRYLGTGQTFTRAESWRSLALMVGHWHLRGYGNWAVEERATGAFVGRLGCWNPEGWPGLEVGWTLRRAFWGRGYAAEGGRAALRYAFEELRQPAVLSLIRPGNDRSVRVALAVGERPAGTVEVMGGPSLVYRITYDEWVSQQGT
jgi:RimJ/RimL family protein N-acetyltransferase